jgi:cytochrome c peroxidase
MIQTGQKLPEGKLFEMTADGPTEIGTSEIFTGKRVALFAVPGAFTPTCHLKHLPGFVSHVDAFKAKGVDQVICLSVNDPFVMGKWGEVSGSSEAGIRMLADPDGSFVKAMGLDFSAAPVGLHNRSKRFAALVEDGVVTVLHVEENPGEAEASSAERLLEAI